MTIDCEKIKEDRKLNKLVIRLKGADEVFANTIRRLVVEEVPTLAVETVEIRDNNSALYDEMLALRLGLMPIKTDLSSYRLPESEAEVEEKSARCTLTLHLKTARNGYVYAEDAQSSDPKCTFVFPQTPIVKLLPKQKVDVTMTAVMGQGRVHTKWSPGFLFYKREQTVSVKNADVGLAKSADGVFSVKGGKLTVNDDMLWKSNLLEQHGTHDGVTVEETDNIILILESWGQLSCKEILVTAADMLNEKAEALAQQL